MTKKIGPKETALRDQREDALDLPDFLKRKETPEQEEKRRKKNAPRDRTDGLKVIEPVAPIPDKIKKVIEKDLKDDVSDVPWREMTGADLKRPRAKARIAHLAEDLPAAAREAAEDAKKKDQKHLEGIAERFVKANVATTPKKKKLSPVVAKALAEREKLAKLAQSASAEPMEKTVKKTAKKIKTVTQQQVRIADIKTNDGSKAAKAFTPEKIKTAADMIKRKSGALSSELQKACKWPPIMVRRFVRDIGRKKLGLSIVCERTGKDSTYKLA